MLQNFVVETVNNPGTATTVQLAGAVSGRRSWYQGFLSAAPVYYAMDDGTQQEWGEGTFTPGAPNTVSRSTVKKNSQGTTARLNFTGLTRIYSALPAEYVGYRTAGDGFSLHAGVLNAPLWGGTSTGSASAYAVSLTPAITTYAAGLAIRFRAHAACAAGATISVNALGAKVIKRIHKGAVANLQPGDIAVGQVVELVYDDTSATFLMTGQLGSLHDWSFVAASSNGSSQATVDFSIPTTFDELRLTLGGVVPAASAIPALRLSFDGGTTFLAGASDYIYSGAQITNSAVTPSGATGTEAQIGPSVLNSGHSLRGEVVWPVFMKTGRVDTHAQISGGALFRWQGSIVCSQAGSPTHVRFLFVGQNVASHNMVLWGRKLN